jgi:6,7-dimethyl-8-ribityllumazine synthase
MLWCIGSGLRVAIVHARWNTKIIDQLVSGAKKNLLAAGVTEDNITVQTVPGSYELPLGVQR